MSTTAFEFRPLSRMKADAKDPVMGFALRFGLLAVSLIGLFGLEVADSWFGFAQYGLTRITALMLTLIKLEPDIVGYTVLLPGVFGIEISFWCSGIPQLTILWFAMLAYPATAGLRLKGLVLALAVVFLGNQIRLILAFLAGVHARELFDVVHDLLGAISIGALLLVWALWARKAGQTRVNSTFSARRRGFSDAGEPSRDEEVRYRF